ncbi:MAG: hypothetical protein WA125_16860 [Desulfosporosinus sp.]
MPEMKATTKNGKTARAIINVLAENGHSVAEASSILSYVNRAIQVLSTVQGADNELFLSYESHED